MIITGEVFQIKFSKNKVPKKKKNWGSEMLVNRLVPPQDITIQGYGHTRAVTFAYFFLRNVSVFLVFGYE